jgi:MFS family permease
MRALLGNLDFVLLWTAAFISFVGDAALSIALPLHVYRQTSSTLSTAAVLAAGLLPRVLFGSIAGTFVDRWDRKRTMIVADVTRACLLLGIIAAPNHIGGLYAVGALQGLLGLFFTPAEGALLPKVVDRKQLVAANALNAVTISVGLLIGPALGALLYTTIGISGTALIDAATYVASAVLLGLIATDGRPERADSHQICPGMWSGAFDDWRTGLAIVLRDESLRILAVSSMLGNVAAGVYMTLGLSPLVLDVLGGTTGQVGWVASAGAAGGLAAGLLIVRVGHRMTPRWLYGGGLIGIGVADLGAANARRVAAAGTPAVGVAVGWTAVGGVPDVMSWTGRQAIIQTQTADAYRGRVFGVLSSANSLAILAGLVVGGVLGDVVGIVPVLSAAAIVRVLGGLVATILLPRHGSRREQAGSQWDEYPEHSDGGST